MVSIVAEPVLVCIAGLANLGDVQEEAVALVAEVDSPLLLWLDCCQEDLIEVVAISADVCLGEVMSLVKRSCYDGVHWASNCFIFRMVTS